MEIRYDTTEDDFVAFNVYHSRTSKSMLRNMQISRFLLPTALVLATLPIFLKSSVVGGMILISPIVIAWIVFYPKYWRHVMKRRVRKMLHEGKNIGLLGEHYLRIDQNGLIEKTSVGESSSTWSGVERVVGSDDYVFIYISSVSAHVIPRRAFASQTEFKTFQELAESYKNGDQMVGRSWMRALVWTVFLMTVPAFLLAQERPTQPGLSLIVQGGIGWNGPARWSFRTGDAPIQPGLSVGIGVQYGPLLQVCGTFLMPSLEIAYAEEKAVHKFSSGQSEYGLQRLPILAGLTVIAQTRLSPFIKLGAGYAKTDFREIVSPRDITNIRFHQWHFVWALGGGLNYAISRDFALGIYSEAWWSEAEIIGINEAGYDNGLYRRFGFSSFGFRATYSPW